MDAWTQVYLGAIDAVSPVSPEQEDNWHDMLGWCLEQLQTLL